MLLGRKKAVEGSWSLQPRLRPREGLAAGVIRHVGHEEAGHSQTKEARRSR